MREQINAENLENVVGGTVVVSADKMRIGFTTLGEKYDLVNTTFEDAMSVIYGMYGSTAGPEFDAKVRDEFARRGWLQ